jgi:putative FmdB family regulatory protein
VPLYEYVCDDNGHRFEVIQKYSDPPIEVCPKCGSRVHKAISSPAFQFKGTGWYVTDYARKESGGGKASESSDSSSKDSKESKDSTTSSTEKDGGAKKTESTSTTDTPKSNT